MSVSALEVRVAGLPAISTGTSREILPPTPSDLLDHRHGPARLALTYLNGSSNGSSRHAPLRLGHSCTFRGAADVSVG